MTKRIVSGVFLLIALGALGLILAGALTSGEQLIVRFLTAIIVAALGLYVISDLRLQADDTAVANSATRATVGGSSRAIATEPPPPNSTAAFMATVTGKRSATTASLDDRGWQPGSDEPEVGAIEDETAADVPLAPTGLQEQAADQDEDVVAMGTSDVAEGPTAGPDGRVSLEGRRPVEALSPTPSVTLETGGDQHRALRSVPALEALESPYSQDALEVGQWPLTPDGRAVTETGAGSDGTDVDGLVAIFTKQAERTQHERAALAVNGGRQPILVGSDAISGSSAFTLREVEPLPVEGDLRAAGPPSPDPAPTGSGATSSEETGITGGGGSEETGITGGGGSEDPGAGATTEAEAPEADPVGAAVVAAVPGGGTPTAHEVAAPELDRAEAEAAVGLVAASYADARIIDLRLEGDGVEDIEAAIRSGELEVIASLIDQGILSTAGPISDREVRTMVFVAFTSNEIRKILLAGGTLDGDPSTLDLGPVEVFTDLDPVNLRTFRPAQLESGSTEPAAD